MDNLAKNLNFVLEIFVLNYVLRKAENNVLKFNSETNLRMSIRTRL